MKTVMDVFKKHLPYKTMDKELTNKIITHRLSWMNKNKDTIEFLSNKLLGVNPIRYSSMDDDNFFIDVCGMDVTSLRKDLHSVDGIIPSHRVQSNPHYLTCIYLIHLSLTTISDLKKANAIALEVYYIFSYKVLSSLITHYFKYDANRDIATMTVERLSYRFLIKRLDNWQSVLEYRGNDVLDPKGLHAKRIKYLSTDTAVKAVSDLQGRIRNTVKEIYTVMMEIIDEGESRRATSLLVDYGEGAEIGSIDNKNNFYVGYLSNIIYKERDFIKKDLVVALQGVFTNISIDEFIKTLKYLVDNSLDNSEIINDILKNSIEVNIDYLQKKNIHNLEDDFVSLIYVLKGFWLSSSSSRNPKVKALKKELYDITQAATGKKTRWLLISISLTIPIYLLIRAIINKKEIR